VKRSGSKLKGALIVVSVGIVYFMVRTAVHNRQFHGRVLYNTFKEPYFFVVFLAVVIGIGYMVYVVSFKDKT